MSNFLSKWHAHKIRCWLLYLKPRVAKQSENVNKSLCLAWGVVVMSWEELWNSLLFGFPPSAAIAITLAALRKRHVTFQNDITADYNDIIPRRPISFTHREHMLDHACIATHFRLNYNKG